MINCFAKSGLNMTYTKDYLLRLFHEFIALPKETEWVDFKHNNSDPKEIGEYISAIANSAALVGKEFGYVVWGIDDVTHEVLGTSFNPQISKVGNEELENWLLRLITPKINFTFNSLIFENKKVVILEIGRAFRHPVRFESMEYLRIGSYKKMLKEFPEKERELWRIFDKTPFEDMNAIEDVSIDDVLRLLDYSSYFKLSEQPFPENRQGIIDRFIKDNLLTKNTVGTYNVTNLGAILFAVNIAEFKTLKRKAVRVIVYKGCSRNETTKENNDVKGYACGFEDLIQYISAVIPSNEIISKDLRKTVPMYPLIAIRELVANALIHQDFFIRGSGPMIEIFSDRIEITNPGEPLVETSRFLDTPPRSRNEAVASFMRRIGICEERGSGVDKVVFQTEFFQLPAPLFEVIEDNTRITLFSHRSFSKMNIEERVHATYLHSCLKYVQRQQMTNSTLRERFGIEKENSAMVSRVIKDALEKKFIKYPEPENESRKYARYVPYWA